MATKLFFKNGAGTIQLAAETPDIDGSTARTWNSKHMNLTQGSSLQSKVTNTITGATVGIACTDGAGVTERLEWITDPITADVTISGTITANIWGLESSMSANVALNVAIYRVSGQTGAVSLIVRSTNVTELGTSAAVNNFTTGMTSGSYTGVSCNRGDRIRIVVFGDDSSAATMASGFTFTFGYEAGAGVNGDSYVSFTENFSFDSLGANTQKLYLTKTASAADDDVLDTGWITPGTVTNVDRGGANAWSNTGNILASDDTYATALLTTTGTDYLSCTNFGISLPANAIVRGIAIEVEGKFSAGTHSYSWQMVNDVGGLMDEASGSGNVFGTSDSTFTYGGQDYYWKSSPETGHLIKATVEDSDFGVVVWCGDTDAGVTASIDRIRIKIFYSQVYRQLEAWTSAGASVAKGGIPATLDGWTSGQIIGAEDPTSNFTGLPGGGVEWLTKPLQATTLSGVMKFNLWAMSSGTEGLKIEVAIVSQDGTTRTLWGTSWLSNQGGGNTFGALPASLAATTVWVGGDDTAITDGQRLSFRLLADDTANARITGLPRLEFTYHGGTGGASGDSWVFLPQTLTEYVPPSGLNAQFYQKRYSYRTAVHDA